MPGTPVHPAFTPLSPAPMRQPRVIFCAVCIVCYIMHCPCSVPHSLPSAPSSWGSISSSPSTPPTVCPTHRGCTSPPHSLHCVPHDLQDACHLLHLLHRVPYNPQDACHLLQSLQCVPHSPQDARHLLHLLHHVPHDPQDARHLLMRTVSQMTYRVCVTFSYLCHTALSTFLCWHKVMKSERSFPCLSFSEGSLGVHIKFISQGLVCLGRHCTQTWF